MPGSMPADRKPTAYDSNSVVEQFTRDKYLKRMFCKSEKKPVKKTKESKKKKKTKESSSESEGESSEDQRAAEKKKKQKMKTL